MSERISFADCPDAMIDRITSLMAALYVNRASSISFSQGSAIKA